MEHRQGGWSAIAIRWGGLCLGLSIIHAWPAICSISLVEWMNGRKMEISGVYS